jgi:hypothetical protein
MTPAIPLLPRHAIELDGPGWLNLFQVRVVGGYLLLSCGQLARALQKRFVFATRDTSLVTVAAMPAFADTKTTTNSSGQSRLEALFEADLQYRSADAVVVSEGREGTYIGSGDGMRTAIGFEERFVGRYGPGTTFIPWSGRSVPEDLHLCTINPAGFIETQDGARIRFDGRSYGQRIRKIAPQKSRKIISQITQILTLGITCRLQVNRRLAHFEVRFLQLNRRPTLLFAAKS